MGQHTVQPKPPSNSRVQRAVPWRFNIHTNCKSYTYCLRALQLVVRSSPILTIDAPATFLIHLHNTCDHAGPCPATTCLYQSKTKPKGTSAELGLADVVDIVRLDIVRNHMLLWPAKMALMIADLPSAPTPAQTGEALPLPMHPECTCHYPLRFPTLSRRASPTSPHPHRAPTHQAFCVNMTDYCQRSAGGPCIVLIRSGQGVMAGERVCTMGMARGMGGSVLIWAWLRV